MTPTDEINHEYTDNIVCPWCGYVERDSWEINDDSGELNCGKCDKPFEFEREHEITYSTTKVEDGAP